jgi:hypothetical protein
MTQDKLRTSYILNSIHDIKYHMQRNIANVIFTGERLNQISNYLPPQQYKLFLNDNFGWSVATAWKKIQIFKKFSKYDINLLNNFDISALYVMVSPLVSQGLIDKLITLSKKDHITAKKARIFLLEQSDNAHHIQSKQQNNQNETSDDISISDELYITGTHLNNILDNNQVLFSQPFLDNMGDVYHYCLHNKDFWTYQHYLKLVSLSENEFANIKGMLFYTESPKYVIFYIGEDPKKMFDCFLFKRII